jgi:hypothetical protein
MLIGSDDKPGAELVPLNPIRVETALSRWPVHRLARKGCISINIREGDAQSGTQTRWEVDYSKKHGQPGPLAYKLDTLIVNRRIEEVRGRIPRILRLGSLSDICKELELADSGKNRSDIKTSLFQNALAGITTKTRYRLADGTEQELEAVFTRYSVVLTGEKLPNGRKADAVHLLLNDIYLQVIKGAMTRPLDYDYLKSLSPAPQRFYELISYKIYAALKYDRSRAKLTYSELCSHAPQTRHVDWNKVRSQMSKVHRPHLQSGYILKVDFHETTDSDGQPDWFMHYLPGPKAKAEYREFNDRGGPNVLEVEPFDDAPPSDTPQATELEQELIQRGVSPAKANDLVRRHSEEKIRFQIECVDWLILKKPEKIEEPGAYLVSAVESDYAAPKRFISKAERQRRDEVKQAKERETAAEYRRKQAVAEAELAERKAIAAYWESCTPERQAEIDKESTALADPKTLALEHGPFKKMGEQLRREEYIRQLLATQAASTPVE